MFMLETQLNEQKSVFKLFVLNVSVGLLSVPQPCQTLYQVFHDAVTRLIQYGILYVAEVSS